LRLQNHSNNEQIDTSKPQSKITVTLKTFSPH
jgi:hypothetical protein